MPRIELTVDGRTVRVHENATLLDAADAAGVEVPRLCHVPGLPPRAVCRLCLVRVHGVRGLRPACATPAEDGQVVDAAAPDLLAMRRLVMEFVLTEHGRCDRADCEVEALADRLGVQTSRWQRPAEVTDQCRHLGSEYIAVRADVCVHCDRCIRACDRRVITRARRGANVGFGFEDGRALADSSCVGCGDCIAACPGGVLQAAR